MDKYANTPFGKLPIKQLGEGDIKLAAQNICPLCEGEIDEEKEVLIIDSDNCEITEYKYCSSCDTIFIIPNNYIM